MANIWGMYKLLPRTKLTKYVYFLKNFIALSSRFHKYAF